MKKIYLLSTFVLLLTSLGNAQNADFKKAMENGNQKYKVKSYNLAMMDYDAAIKIISAETDKLIASKTALAPEKKYLLEAFEKRANCAFYLKNSITMNADIDKVLLLDSTNSNAKALKAYNLNKSGKKIEGCVKMKKEEKNGSEVAGVAFKECFCNNDGITLAKEAITDNNMKKYDDAIKKLDQALSILPDSGYIHGEKGKSLVGKGDYEGALKSLNTAVRLSKRDYKTYYSRALVYQKLNQVDSAMNDLNECTKLKSTFYEAYLLRADLAEEKEMWSSAIFDLKNCIKMKPSDGKLDFRVAEILYKHNEDLIDACTYYKSSNAKGFEDAAEMATNCDNIKYMKSHGKNAQKEK